MFAGLPSVTTELLGSPEYGCKFDFCMHEITLHLVSFNFAGFQSVTTSFTNCGIQPLSDTVIQTETETSDCNLQNTGLINTLLQQTVCELFRSAHTGNRKYDGIYRIVELNIPLDKL